MKLFSVKDILSFNDIESYIWSTNVFLIPVILIFSIIGFSFKLILNRPLVKEKLISLKKFESYSFFNDSFNESSFNSLPILISLKTRIVSFEILLLPEISILLTISAKLRLIKKNMKNIFLIKILKILTYILNLDNLKLT